MGKWTLEYHDDVLRNKMKSLVDGAIKRAKLEKTEPQITYEAFVADLAEGDSFTSSLIDVLVKELADRRARPNPIDRRLISERTAKALRMQAAPLHIYRERYTTNPRRRFAVDYALTPNPGYLDGEDDEPTEIIEAGNAPEGTRINSDLYDAYRPPSYDHIVERIAEPLSTTSSTSDTSAERAVGVHPMSPPMSAPSRSFWPSNASLAIRRPPRSRTIDFSDFTTRRRSVYRQTAEEASSSEPVRSEDSSDGTWRFSSTLDRPGSGAATTTLSGPSRPRRFFSLAAWADSTRRVDTEDTLGSEERDGLPEDPLSPDSLEFLYSQNFRDLPPLGPPSGSLTLPERHSERPGVPPRLRRGGLRAPESLLSFRSSPFPTAGTSTEGGETGSNTPDSGPPVTTIEPRALQLRSTSEGATSGDDRAGQLLTPRSISPVSEHLL